MRFLSWLVVGWLGMVLFSALSSRLFGYGLQPSWVVVVLTFLALRREMTSVALTASILGYLVGRLAGAPVGIHEAALAICGLSVFVGSGSIAGRGTLFFAGLCGWATAVYHITLYVLLLWGQGRAGFSSLPSSLLIFDAAFTALVALFVYHPMVWLDVKLTPKVHEGLAWS